LNNINDLLPFLPSPLPKKKKTINCSTQSATSKIIKSIKIAASAETETKTCLYVQTKELEA
jgi:hypothetical protein